MLGNPGSCHPERRERRCGGRTPRARDVSGIDVLPKDAGEDVYGSDWDAGLLTDPAIWSPVPDNGGCGLYVAKVVPDPFPKRAWTSCGTGCEVSNAEMPGLGENGKNSVPEAQATASERNGEISVRLRHDAHGGGRVVVTSRLSDGVTVAAAESRNFSCFGFGWVNDMAFAFPFSNEGGGLSRAGIVTGLEPGASVVWGNWLATAGNSTSAFGIDGGWGFIERRHPPQRVASGHGVSGHCRVGRSLRGLWPRVGHRLARSLTHPRLDGCDGSQHTRHRHHWLDVVCFPERPAHDLDRGRRIGYGGRVSLREREFVLVPAREASGRGRPVSAHSPPGHHVVSGGESGGWRLLCQPGLHGIGRRRHVPRSRRPALHRQGLADPQRPGGAYRGPLAVSQDYILMGETNSPQINPADSQNIRRLLRFRTSDLDALAKGW